MKAEEVRVNQRPNQQLRPAGWGSQPLRIPRCATIPHCAPLECGDWMCRAAIDISLLWSERRDNLRCGIHRRGEVTSPDGLADPTPTGWGTQLPTGIGGVALLHIAPLERKGVRRASIVGARFPRPMGWGTQPLRVQRCATIPHMRSSGALGLDVSRCYRHIAPLERKAAQFAARYPLWGRGLLAQRVGEPNPYEFHVPGFPASLHPCVKISLTSRRASGAGTGSAAASGYPSVSSVLTDSAVQPGHRPAVPTHR